MPQNPASVLVLKPGYARWEGYASQRACGTITLVRSQKNCIVDLGIPADKAVILKQLKAQKLSPTDIDFVILTHSDVDHIGKLTVDSSEAWEPWSQDKELQDQSRKKIRAIADYIIPGHGDMFAVDKSLEF